MLLQILEKQISTCLNELTNCHKDIRDDNMTIIASIY